MRELLCQFGPDQGMVGVLTLPDHGAQVEKTGVLLFNVGANAHYGPHRINVKLARALVRQGVPTLRFDLSGVGDSAAADGALDYREQAVADLKAAMDHAQVQAGLQRFVVVGICSGAVHAYRVAQEDARVVGVVMMDGYWYASAWTAWVRRWKRLRTASWLSVPLAAARSLLSDSRAARGDGVMGSSDPHSANPSQDAFSGVMQHLVERGVAVYLLYSATMLDYVNYGAQLHHVFKGAAWLDRIRCELHEEFDHTLSTCAGQQRFIELLCDWLSHNALS